MIVASILLLWAVCVGARSVAADKSLARNTTVDVAHAQKLFAAYLALTCPPETVMNWSW